MSWYIIVPLAMIILCVIIFLTKLSIRIVVVYTAQEKQVLVRFRIWLIPFTIDVLKLIEKRKQKQKEKPQEEEHTEHTLSDWLAKLPDLIKSAGDIHTILKSFLRKIKVKKFLWSSQMGTGDADVTGILAGFVWSIKGIAVAVVSQYMKLVRKPEIEVHPVFQGAGVATRMELAMSFRIGQAMIMGVKLLRYIRKHREVFVSKAEQVQQ